MLGSDKFKARALFESDVLLQGLYVWFIAAGQLALGFLVVFFFSQFGPIDPLLAHVIELGWIGGHGAAGAFKGLFPHSAAGDIALFSATLGLLWGAVSGFFLVKRAKRHYRTPEPEQFKESEEAVESGNGPALPLLFLVLAVFLAYLLKDALVYLAGDRAAFLEEVPPFFLAIFTGLFLKILADRAALPIAVQMRSINSLVLDALIAAALATLVLDSVLSSAAALAALSLAGAIWCLVCFYYFARFFLPADIRLELCILNYGMSTGITALGLLLLQSLAGRIPEKAVRVYGMAAPLSAPFIGGGIISLYFLPGLSKDHTALAIFCGLMLALALLLAMAMLVKRAKVT
jgi:ESS family glutamate:Na+ symporter